MSRGKTGSWLIEFDALSQETDDQSHVLPKMENAINELRDELKYRSGAVNNII
jgi:hypothetical protein